MHDVATHRIMRRGAEAILVLDPERIIRRVGPAVVVRIGKAGVARKAKCKIQITVFAGDATVAVVADEQVLDDELELTIDTLHLPDLLAVFRDIHRIVLGAVADFVHDGLEDVTADFLDQVPLRVKILTCGGSSVSIVLNNGPEIATQRLPSLSTAAEEGVSSP